jgi:ATP-dependent RNA helicase RhlE
LSSKFESLGLAPALVRAVADEGYTDPTPIQLKAIPVILEGRDVLAAAQTGTGKTAGFTLPILHKLAQQQGRPAPKTARVLILTPTRELAAQVEESVRTYGRHVRVTSALVFGGVGMQPQVDALRRGVDILVATPGRLLDHVGQKTVDLSKVEILVLDEADRMLDMGFIHDIKRVLALLPKQRQNLLFSATFSDDIRALAGGLLKDPVSVEVARRNQESALVTQIVHPVSKERKRELLRDLIAQGDWQQVLVFTRMKHGANRLAEQLTKDGLNAAAIHGNKSQGARTRALAGFKDGSVRVLVATDIAARGLDIEQLPHVVNYELPNVPEDYVHRIGRTGRAGSPGHAVSLVSPDENDYLRDIERLLKKALPRTVVPGFEAGKPGTIPHEEDRRPPRPGPRRGSNETRGQSTGAGKGAGRGAGRTAPRNPSHAESRQHAPRHASPRPAQPAHPTPGAHTGQAGAARAKGTHTNQGAAAPAKTAARPPRHGARRDEGDPNVRSNLPPALANAFRRGR